LWITRKRNRNRKRRTREEVEPLEELLVRIVAMLTNMAARRERLRLRLRRRLPMDLDPRDSV